MICESPARSRGAHLLGQLFGRSAQAGGVDQLRRDEARLDVLPKGLEPHGPLPE